MHHFCTGSIAKNVFKMLGSKEGAMFSLIDTSNKAMPMGSFCSPFTERRDKPRKRDKLFIAYDWLYWLTHSRKINRLINKMNSGRKIHFYPIDGLDQGTNTMFQGCNWHGHACHLIDNVEGEKSDEKLSKEN